MKILLLLSLIGLAFSARMETYNFGFQAQICIDSLSLNLPKECINYELNCQDCYQEKYLKECMFSCIKDNSVSFNEQCSAKCFEMRDFCDNCFNTWRKCTCPLGTTSIKKDDGTSSCQLLKCPDGYWRSPLSKCVDCSPCDMKCKTCQDSSINCQDCNQGYCLVESNKCVNPKEYTCPNGLYKHYSIQGCPICEGKCPVGQYPNEFRECINCPKECTSCSSATSCDTCDSDYCLYNHQCVLPSFSCPANFYKKYHNSDKCFDCVECSECLQTQFCDNQIHECNNKCDLPSFIYQKQCIDTCPLTPQTITLVNYVFDTSIVGQNFKRNYNDYISNVDQIINQCNGVIYMGNFGQGAYLQKNYVQFPPHNSLKISLTLYAFDTWDQSDLYGHDEFQIYAEDKLVFTYQKNYNSNTTINCINPAVIDDIYQISFIIPHNSSTLKFKLTSTLNQDAADESWGFNNLKIEAISDPKETYLIYKQPKDLNQCVFCESCPYNTYCNKDKMVCDECIGQDKFIWKFNCISECPREQFRFQNTCLDKCPNGYFGNDSTKKCEICNSNCLTCVGSATTCVFPCAKNLIFWNNKCVQSCDSNYFISKKITDLTGYLCYPSEGDDCECRKCNETCSTCLGPNSNDCILCKDSLLLKNGQCIQQCPAGDYVDQAEKSCNCCHQGCATCWGPRIDQCNSCDANHFRIDSTCHMNANKVGTTVQNILSKQGSPSS